MVSPKVASVLKKAQSLGRRGDTILAHINPYEAKVLKSLGGSGTVNPHTGLREFSGADGSGSSVTSSNYSGGSSGGSSLSGFTGGGSSPSGVSGGGFSTSGGGSYSSTDGGGWSPSGGGDGGSMAAARTADRQSVYNYSSDPYSPNSYVMGSMDRSTPYNPMGPAGLSGSMVRGVLDGASGISNALNAGAGKLSDIGSSIGQSLLDFSDWSRPAISSATQTVSNQAQQGFPAVQGFLSDTYGAAKSYVSDALKPSASSVPSYTQMAAMPAPEYFSPSDMGVPVDKMGRLPDGSLVTPQAERDYWNQRALDFNRQLLSDPMANVEGGSGNYMSKVPSAPAPTRAPMRDYLERQAASSNVPSAPAPTRAPMRDYIERQAASANVPSGTISGAGYSGPKGVNASINGMLPHLGQAAYEAGGGLTLDPAAVARISGRLGYTPVGLRTNNPGNILDGKFAQGQAGYIGSTTSKNGLTYANFSSPEYGVNAVEALISGPTYYGAGRQSINDIINRYAPVDENNSAAANAAYKNYISDQLGVSKYATLSPDQLGQMARAKVAFENGGDPLVNATPAVSYNGGAVTEPPVYSTPQPAQPSAPQSSVPDVPQVDTTLPQAPQVAEVPSYAIETDKLIADIRENVWGSGMYSDADIVDQIVKSGVGTVNPDTGKIEVTASDTNGDGAIDQQDVNSVIEGLKADYKVDPSQYWSPLGPPTQTNVAANPIMANMGVVQPPESPDFPSYQAVVAGDPQTPEYQAPMSTLAHLSVYDAPIGVDPNGYDSPLTLPAQPNPMLSKGINTLIGMTPLGIPNTIAGLFGYGIGDQIANADNIPMTAEDLAAQEERRYASTSGGSDRDTRSTSPSPEDIVANKRVVDSVSNEAWMQSARNFGFSEAQLKDNKTKALIKELFDMGFFA